MKKQYLIITLFYSILLVSKIVAQQPDSITLQRIDSMKIELANPNITDTTRLRILYLIGQETWIFRETYWDSIVAFSSEVLKKSRNENEIYALHEIIAGSLNSLGFIKKYKGDINQALNYYQLSIKEYSYLKETQEKAAVLNNIGRIYISKGEFDKGLELFHKSLKIVENQNDSIGVSMALINIGMMYFEQGEKQKGLEYVKKSINIRIKINDQKGLGESYHNLGTMMYHLNKMDSAEIFIKKGLTIREKINDLRGKSESLRNLANIYLIKNEFDKAKSTLDKALEIKNSINDKEGSTYLLYTLTDIKLKENDIAGAFKIAKENLIISKQLGYPKCIKNAAEKLCQLYKLKGNYKDALEMYELHIQMRDSINNEATQKATLQQQAKYEYEKQKALDDKEHEKQLAIEQEAKKKQKVITYATTSGLVLVVLFLIFVFNRLQITKRQKTIIEQQKVEVEQQKQNVETAHQQLEEKNEEIIASIRYAKRIQEALMTSHKYIERNIIRLKQS